jgi:chromate transporter
VKFRGIPGAVAAVFGLTLLPVVIAVALAYFYFQFHQIPAVQGILKGAAAAAVALTLSMVFKTGRKCLTGLVPVALFAAIFLMNGLARWPLLACLSLLAPLAVAWAWPRTKKP